MQQVLDFLMVQYYYLISDENKGFLIDYYDDDRLVQYKSKIYDT